MFTESELKAMNRFRAKHRDCYHKHQKQNSSFTIKTVATGIGYYTSIVCDSCGVSENVTDYESW